MPAISSERRVFRKKKATLWRRIVFTLFAVPLGLAILSISLTVLFRYVNPPVTMLMIERRIESWSSGGKYSPRYDWVALEGIAPPMPLAVIASEDQNFMHHHGFDWEA